MINNKDNKKIPIKKGDILKLAVIKFGKEGDPILRYDGFIIFLKNTDKRGFELNKIIEIKITKILPKFAIAELK